jgi:brefeldin A-inhibited guanine nucleotide-exchange protein
MLKKKDNNFLMDLQSRIEFNNTMKHNMERAIILFNDKPRKGLEFLFKNDIMRADPDIIAEFLLTTPGLSKYSIG